MATCRLWGTMRGVLGALLRLLMTHQMGVANPSTHHSSISEKISFTIRTPSTLLMNLAEVKSLEQDSGTSREKTIGFPCELGSC